MDKFKDFAIGLFFLLLSVWLVLNMGAALKLAEWLHQSLLLNKKIIKGIDENEMVSMVRNNVFNK